MPPHDDDGEEAGGPPPDPSLREWRHPSEIAAAAAAANRPVSPPKRRLQLSIVPIGGTALGLFALVGLALYVVSSMPSSPPISLATRDADPTGALTSAPDRSPASITSSTAASAIASLDITTGASARSNTAEEDAGEGSPGRDAETAPVDETVPTTPETTTTPVEPTTTTVLEDGALLAPELLPPAEEQLDGVFGLNGSSQLTRLGGYLALEGLVFTSASVVAGHERVVVLSGDVWNEADVVATDATIDVALIAVNGGFESEQSLQQTSGLSVDQSATDADDSPHPGTDISIEVPGQETEAGTVIGDGQRTDTTGGATVYGALRTSIQRPDGVGGAPIVDEDTGRIVGMAISSDGYLLSAVPIHRVLEFGRAQRDSGISAFAWLGVKATSQTGGGVLLTEVVEDGPAALAGLQVGDVIVGLDGMMVDGRDHFVYLIRAAGVEAIVRFELLRDDGLQLIDAVVGSNPAVSAGS